MRVRRDRRRYSPGAVNGHIAPGWPRKKGIGPDRGPRQTHSLLAAEGVPAFAAYVSPLELRSRVLSPKGRAGDCCVGARSSAVSAGPQLASIRPIFPCFTVGPREPRATLNHQRGASADDLRQARRGAALPRRSGAASPCGFCLRTIEPSPIVAPTPAPARTPSRSCLTARAGARRCSARWRPARCGSAFPAMPERAPTLAMFRSREWQPVRAISPTPASAPARCRRILIPTPSPRSTSTI